MQAQLMTIILSIPAVLIGFTVHEYAHAKVADILGDPTPKMQGRLTLSPFAHVDPLGFVLLLIFGFGWAKPVQTNPRNFKNYRKDDLKVSISGIIANIFAAAVFGLIFGLFNKVLYNSSIITSENVFTISFIITRILYLIVYINCVLAIFNIIPLPGLDGFHILRNLAPAKFYRIEGDLYRYSTIIFLVLIFPILGGNSIIGVILGPPVSGLTTLFTSLI